MEIPVATRQDRPEDSTATLQQPKALFHWPDWSPDPGLRRPPGPISVTKGREQTATQRKFVELLRALPEVESRLHA